MKFGRAGAISLDPRSKLNLMHSCFACPPSYSLINLAFQLPMDGNGYADFGAQSGFMSELISHFRFELLPFFLAFEEASNPRHKRV